VSGQGIAQILVYVVVLIVLAYPLGLYMTRVYSAARLPLGSLERGFLRLVGGGREQDWKGYAKAVLVFSAVCSAVLYALLRLQGHLPLNPDHRRPSRRTSRSTPSPASSRTRTGSTTGARRRCRT